MTKLKNKERHTQPLKTALNSRVLQNPTSARQATRAGRAGGTQKKGESYNCNYFSYKLRSCLPVVENHQRTVGNTGQAARCPSQTQASLSKLTLATLYNLPHRIKQDIKVRETYLYFLRSKEKNNKTIC